MLGPLAGGALIGAATRGRARWVALALVGLLVMMFFAAAMLGSALNEGGGIFVLGMALVAAIGLAMSALLVRDVYA